MRPGRRCPICDADAITRAKIESLRETGNSYREVNALVPGFDIHKIRRHFKHVGKAAAVVSKLSPLEQSEQRLEQLANRAEQSWIAAAASGDSKVALDVLKASIRLQLDQHARLLEKAETEADDLDSEKNLWPTVQQYDNVKGKVFACYEKWRTQWGWITCPVCENIKPIDPKIVSAKIKNYLESHNDNSGAN